MYVYSMPSHVKAVLDRMLALSKPEMKVVDNQVYHPVLKDRTEQKNIVISGCGFPDWKNNFEPLRILCDNAFRSTLTAIFVPEAPMLNAPQAAPVVEPLLEKFRKAGAEYAENGSLRPETLAGLETPMIDAELYIRICNGEGIK